MKITTADIIQQWLKQNGYDGLCDPDEECGCHVDDLSPCGEIPSHCRPGHNFPDIAKEKGCKIWIGERKKGGMR